jgi:hypothetical protein
MSDPSNLRREGGPLEIYQYVMAVAAFLTGAATGAFFLMVIGVHKGDRARHLSDTPDTQLEALTRRALSLGFRP